MVDVTQAQGFYVLPGAVKAVVASGGQLVVESGGALNVLGALKFDTGSSGAGAGTLFGGGTNAAPLTTSTAAHFIEWRMESTAISGTSRGLYLALASEGAGQDNDAVRIFHRTRAAVTGGHGAHISNDFDLGGSISGLGTALRCTLHVPDRALLGGNYAALQGEIYMDGNSADISGVSRSSIMRLVVSGANATARNTLKNMLFLSCETGSGKMVQTATGAPGNQTGSIRIDVNGTTRYLMFWDAQAST